MKIETNGLLHNRMIYFMLHSEVASFEIPNIVENLAACYVDLYSRLHLGGGGSHTVCALCI